ncbi:ROK family protein [bacterium]|nr:ROK family protein [bacterium]
MNSEKHLPCEPLQCVPPLDRLFMPAALVARAYQRAVAASGGGVPVRLALEQADGSRFLFDTRVLPDASPDAAWNVPWLERLVKFVLWSRGGYRIVFSGPRALGETLRRHFASSPTGRFDAEIMGARIYERPFDVVFADELPGPYEATRPLGRHLDGCRIGFDLGASDRKVAAVVDGTVVFSEEVPWNPATQADPQWHFDELMAMLKSAAAHLPRVDAIGGSAAGVYVNNRVKVASLFRAVPKPLFDSRVKDLFLELQRAWNGVPFEVVNDGEVTALAGSMALDDGAVLGIALGSSEAAGYVTSEGCITSWLNELAFAPVDLRPDAPVDEWSGDRGCGVQYFSQQCVGRLVGPAGITVDAALPLPEKLKRVQELMARGDERARKIYETIGVYLGYTAAHYAAFYDVRHILILGRVTSGDGGTVILDEARRVLGTEFPDLAKRIAFRSPDERSKRHGQAIAAASLPA